jgi:hypothetical protein
MWLYRALRVRYISSLGWAIYIHSGYFTVHTSRIDCCVVVYDLNIGSSSIMSLWWWFCSATILSTSVCAIACDCTRYRSGIPPELVSLKDQLLIQRCWLMRLIISNSPYHTQQFCMLRGKVIIEALGYWHPRYAVWVEHGEPGNTAGEQPRHTQPPSLFLLIVEHICDDDTCSVFQVNISVVTRVATCSRCIQLKNLFCNFARHLGLLLLHSFLCVI